MTAGRILGEEGRTAVEDPAQATEARRGAGAYRSRGITLVRGEGAWLWDSEGRRYVDCVGGQGAAILGHGHPRLAETLARQAARLISCPGSFANDARGAVYERLAAFTGMARFFLCNSGTEAVEAALKYARWSTGRSRLVACMRGFHGRTMGSLSVTWDRHYREPFAPLVPDAEHVPFGRLEGLDELARDAAAILVEPVQGEGGVRPAPAGYLAGLREICDRHGTLLIFDEIQTGLGRTGRPMAAEHWGVQADLVTLGKGLAGGVPMGALALREGLEPFPVGAHGSTFGGNPLAAAAAVTVLEVIEADRLPQRARRLGEEALATLRRELQSAPQVREVRGLGLLIGIELRSKAGPLLQRLAAEDGILALPAGPTVLRLLPPLVIAEDDLRRVIERLVVRLRGGA
jgi:acetylornithine/LysW-gamma-L-lysine aminotransferase